MRSPVTIPCIRNFFQKKDLELLLSKPVDLDSLNDDTFGRMLDRLYEANTTHLLSALSQNAHGAFGPRPLAKEHSAPERP